MRSLRNLPRSSPISAHPATAKYPLLLAETLASCCIVGLAASPRSGHPCQLATLEHRGGHALPAGTSLPPRNPVTPAAQLLRPVPWQGLLAQGSASGPCPSSVLAPPSRFHVHCSKHVLWALCPGLPLPLALFCVSPTCPHGQSHMASLPRITPQMSLPSAPPEDRTCVPAHEVSAHPVFRVAFELCISVLGTW